jgi:hypothetical protein
MIRAAAPDGARYVGRVMIKGAGVDVLTSDVDLPVPFAGGNVSLYSSMEEKGFTELTIFFLEREKGTFVAELDPVKGGSYYKRARIFFVGPVTLQDIQEPGVMDRLVRDAKKKMKMEKKKKK